MVLQEGLLVVMLLLVSVLVLVLLVGCRLVGCPCLWMLQHSEEQQQQEQEEGLPLKIHSLPSCHHRA